MSDDRDEKLMQDAADIFFQLRNDPDNPDLQARRDAFIARGKEEKETYEYLLKAWKASGMMRAPKTLRNVVILICGLASATAIAYEPVRIALIADLSTAGKPQQSVLDSGDVAFLDADTALVDGTNGESRAITLLEGAAFFDVQRDARPFTVGVGDIQVSVVGTQFETAFVEDTVIVNVTEGQVHVSYTDQIWELSAGDQLVWSDAAGATVAQKDTATMATWRNDRLVVDGLTLGQAADIIARRMNGPVLFAHSELRNTRVAGNIDLAEPLSSLRILAEFAGGRVYHVPGIGRIVTRR